ncbi:protein TASOR-like isoform X1 [Acipenser ruthenus]|uniref:protein TASOR-like isoform X1 n=2 Tax=Acipenser ruthenus TaxID=7906 RepID=UPI00145BDCAF|nr:protein TASOR-like isoform X1 [Acipenser ruthenus]
MASSNQNVGQETKGDGRSRGGSVSIENSDVPKHLMPGSALTSKQDGEQAVCEAGPVLLAGQEDAERRRSSMSDLKTSDNGSAAFEKAALEQPRRSFHIPRKNKEKKALFQFMSLDSREFKEILKIMSSSYLDPSSGSTFSYKKASLIHSELLEKEFIEKKRELKQDGRTEKELVESYAFLLADPTKLNWICEKGLDIGHSRVTTLGKPSLGVYLSKHADLLQINPFDVGATGEIIIFKVMKGRIKSIYENMSKNILDPTPKFDCHVSKNSSRVTTLWSYRAFELTQTYFYEYVFDDIKKRPRHVCPYAVVSFMCQDKGSAPVPKPLPPPMSVSNSSDGGGGKGHFTVWSGQFLNKGNLICHADLKSDKWLFPPFKLPEKLDVGSVMSLDQVKLKIPAAVFYRDTYNRQREVLKSGMYCSLFELLEKSKSGSSLPSVLQKLEKEKLVLVKPLEDKGFLFLLSSSQMVYNELKGEQLRCLQALFLFQEPRDVVKAAKSCATAAPQSTEGTEEIMPHLMTFIPALHYGLMKSRNNTSTPPNIAVERCANDYLRNLPEGGRKRIREFVLYEYDQKLDHKKALFTPPYVKTNIDKALHFYLYESNAFKLSLSRVREMVESSLRVPECSREGSEGKCESKRLGRGNGSEHAPLSQKTSHNAMDDPEKLKELIHLIQSRKKHMGEGAESEEFKSVHSLKRKLEGDDVETAYKHLRTWAGENGEDLKADVEQSPDSSSLITCLGGQDTDLRKQDPSSTVAADTQSLIQLLLDTLTSAGGASAVALLNKPLDSGCAQEPPMMHGYEDSEKEGALMAADPSSTCNASDLRLASGDERSDGKDSSEEQMAGSVSSLEGFSPCSSTQLEQTHHREQGARLPGDSNMAWKLIPITGMKSQTYRLAQEAISPHDPRVLHSQDSSPLKFTQVSSPTPAEMHEDDKDAVHPGWSSFTAEYISAEPRDVESTVFQEFGGFTTKVQELLRQENVLYSTKSVVSIPEKLTSGFSKCVRVREPHVPVQNYVDKLCEKMRSLVDSEKLRTAARYSQLSSSPPEQSLQTGARLGTVTNTPQVQMELSQSPSKECLKQDEPEPEQQSLNVNPAALSVPSLDTAMEPEPAAVAGSRDGMLPLGEAAAHCPQISSAVQAPAAFSNLINQLKPEVFSSLVKIIKDVQKNTLKFYIHAEEESTVCTEIKEYLMRLGNAECNPQNFLEKNSSLDKLLIIIQNEDIAANIHEIPALVSLKKLPSVSFAGVDSLDDVKNHTYNELFVSGGFIVSDESVLNPDVITVEKLQSFLNFLEERNTQSNWQWKIHFKTQKKLKEMGRMNSKVLSLLTLLNSYQKKHLVEFLSYHECDSQSRQAPELDCLIKLQAQNIQRRHVVFLTEKRFEMFPKHCNNGVVVATIEDFMQSFQSLIGFNSSSTEDKCVPGTSTPEVQPGMLPVGELKEEEEDMSIDSEEESSKIELCGGTIKAESLDPGVCIPAMPAESQTAPLLHRASGLDLEALRSAISIFTSSAAKDPMPLALVASPASPTTMTYSMFNVNTYQSFLGTGPETLLTASNTPGDQQRAEPAPGSTGSQASAAPAPRNPTSPAAHPANQASSKPAFSTPNIQVTRNPAPNSGGGSNPASVTNQGSGSHKAPACPINLGSSRSPANRGGYNSATSGSLTRGSGGSAGRGTVTASQGSGGSAGRGTVTASQGSGGSAGRGTVTASQGSGGSAGRGTVTASQGSGGSAGRGTVTASQGSGGSAGRGTVTASQGSGGSAGRGTVTASQGSGGSAGRGTVTASQGSGGSAGRGTVTASQGSGGSAGRGTVTASQGSGGSAGGGSGSAAPGTPDNSVSGNSAGRGASISTATTPSRGRGTGNASSGTGTSRGRGNSASRGSSSSSPAGSGAPNQGRGGAAPRNPSSYGQGNFHHRGGGNSASRRRGNRRGGSGHSLYRGRGHFDGYRGNGAPHRHNRGGYWGNERENFYNDDFGTMFKPY